MSDNFTKVSPTVTDSPVLNLLSGEVVGLEISSNSLDSEHDIDISPGICMDSTSRYPIELTSTLTKRLDEIWAAGDDSGGRVISDSDSFTQVGDTTVFTEYLDSSAMTGISETQAVIFRDGDALAVTMSGSVPTLGGITTVHSSTSSEAIATVSATKAIACYYEGTYKGTACILTVSGTTVTAGTPATFNNGTTSKISVAMLSNTKAIVAYRDGSNYGTVCVLTIDGTTITPGTPVIYNSSTTDDIAITALSETKAVVCSQEAAGNASARVLEIDGTTITTVGPPSQFDDSTNPRGIAVAGISETKAIATYVETGSNNGMAVILDDIDGLTITVGTPVTYDTGYVSNTDPVQLIVLSDTLVVVVYDESQYTQDANMCALVIDGSTIIPHDPIDYSNPSSDGYEIISAKLSSTQILVIFTDEASSYYANGVLLTNDYVQTDTWYYPWMVRKDSDASVDVILTTDGSNPTFPLGYTYSRRSEYGVFTNSSGNISSVLGKGYIIYIDTSSGNVTVPLPAIADDPGKILTVKLIDDTNQCIISGNGSDTIDGMASLSLATMGDYATLQVYDSEWKVVSKHIEYTGDRKINGLEISNNTTDSDHDIDIATGSCRDSTGKRLLELTSGLTKQLNALFTEGSEMGGLAREFSPYGTPVVFNSAVTSRIASVPISSTKSIVCYTDEGISNYGYACVLNVSGSVITPGTPAVFESAETYYNTISLLSDTKAIVCYYDVGNSGYGTACVLEISGSTITPGIPVVFESAASIDVTVCSLTSTKAIVCYKDQGNSNYGTACLLNISGSTITPETPVVFESASTSKTVVTSLDSTKAVVCYRDEGNSNYGTSCVLDVSGSTITPGAPVVFETGSLQHLSITTISNTKALICYQALDDSGKGSACALNVSGSTIVPGTPIRFTSLQGVYISVAALDDSHAIVACNDEAKGWDGTTRILNISEDNITARKPVLFTNFQPYYNSVSSLSASQAILCYQGNVGDYGTAILIDESSTASLMADSWYYTWLIRKDSDGSVDVLFSLEDIYPPMPLGYTYKRRIRGAILTDASANANILGFYQKDNYFYWDVVILDRYRGNPGTNALLEVTSAPPNMLGVFNLRVKNPETTTTGVLWTSPYQTDTDPITISDYYASTTNGISHIIVKEIQCDGLGQIRVRLSYSHPNINYTIHCLGFIDPAQD